VLGYVFALLISPHIVPYDRVLLLQDSIPSLISDRSGLRTRGPPEVIPASLQRCGDALEGTARYFSHLGGHPCRLCALISDPRISVDNSFPPRLGHLSSAVDDLGGRLRRKSIGSPDPFYCTSDRFSLPLAIARKCYLQPLYREFRAPVTQSICLRPGAILSHLASQLHGRLSVACSVVSL